MNKFFALSLLIFALGCHRNGCDFENNFLLIDTISFNVENKVLSDVNFHTYHYYIHNEDISLSFMKDDNIIGYDHKMDSIKFFISLSQLDSIVYRDHLFHNQDSIFICGIVRRSLMYILLMNKEGEVYKWWNIHENSDTLQNAFFYIDSKYLHPMVLLNNKLYFQASYRYKPGTIINQEVPVEMMLDLSTGIPTQFGDLPPEYKKGDFYGNHQNDYSRTINKNNEFVFSFPISEEIFVYSQSGELLKIVECKSKYLDKIEPMKKENYFDLSAIIDAYTYSPQYGEIIYDRYNDRYYRLVLHKLEKYANDGKVNNWNKRNWSLIVLDKDFNKINEVIMPVNKFYKHFIVTDKGLLMMSADLENLYKCYIYKLKS